MAENRTDEFMALARAMPLEGALRTPANNGSIPQISGGDSSSPYSFNTPSNSSGGAIGRYQSNQKNSTGPNSNLHPAYDELRTFHQTASGISKDIAATSHLLQELTSIVKSNSLFSDDAPRVNALILRIKTSTEQITQRLDQANATIQYQKRRLGQNSQAGQEATNVMDQLKAEFVATTKNFKTVLQRRSETLEAVDQQKKQVYGGNVDCMSLDHRPPVYQKQNNALPNSELASNNLIHTMPTIDLSTPMTAGEPSGSTLPRPHGAIGDGTGSLYTTPDLRMRRSTSESYGFGSSSMAAGGATGPVLTPLDMQRLEAGGDQQQVQLIPDQTYLRERADAMSQVETSIVELGTLFNKLAVMVTEHRELVHRVEDNVDEANSNINLSMDVLTDTLTNLRTNRALATKVFSVLVFFIILFIVFFA